MPPIQKNALWGADSGARSCAARKKQRPCRPRASQAGMQACRSGPWVRLANVHPDGGRHADQRGGQWDVGRHGDCRGGLLASHHAVHHGVHPAPLRDGCQAGYWDGCRACRHGGQKHARPGGYPGGRPDGQRYGHRVQQICRPRHRAARACRQVCAGTGGGAGWCPRQNGGYADRNR